MDKPFVLYGGVGTGAVAVEAALRLIGLDYQFVDADPFGDEAARARAKEANPLGQVPALVMPGGETMTESAAILIWLADRFPEAMLAPRPEDRRRVAFLRWMVFIAADIYPMYTLKDVPGRFTPEEGHAELERRAVERIVQMWRVMEAGVEPAPYALGHQMSVLDLYVTVVSRWTPRRRVFRQTCPKLATVAERVDRDARLAGLWAERFPFAEGWEG